MKRHHLKLTQLFNCECQSTSPSPHPFSHSFTQFCLTLCTRARRQPPESTVSQRQPTEQPPLQVRTSIMTKPTKNGEGGGHSQQNKWEKKLSSSKGLLCLAVAAFVIVLVTERSDSYSYFMIHKSRDGMTESHSLAANWKTSASCQRRSIRT